MGLLHRVRVWFRSAITGRFVSKDYADDHKKTTTKETRR